mgnify:CR=1 FL=1
MQSEKWFIVLAVVALVAATLACGESTPEVSESSGGSEETAEEATSAPTGQSRSNPAPPGSEVTIDEMTLVIDDAARPADDIVAEGNQFNSPPEEGSEYVMVDLSVTCEKGEDETCSIGPMLDLSIIGSQGVTHDSEWAISGVDGQLESTEFYGGSTVSGKLFFEVGQDETDLVLRYESLLGTSKAFMAVP